ncbi:MAG: AmmeMemoRadiSam system protein B [Acidobacteriota bacterium]|nr:AmmeMemoRadiSam system protein B [Acidobacteriota bacterium]
MPDAEPVRSPAVAGTFYPADAAILRRDVSTYLKNGNKSRALGSVVPHAGYMYSGHVAGAVYAHLELPRRFVILCPNHTGAGEPLAIMSAGAWATPLGTAKIDNELAAGLKAAFPYLEEDAQAHRTEHSLEVQLPFLQVLLPDFSFVPICIGVGQLAVLQALGQALAAVLAKQDGIMVIASSDMNHYESDAITRVKDGKAIDRILALDPAGLHDTVRRERISMCGYGPTVAMLTATKALGATQAELVKYATSGDISGDRDAVVGYAGIVVR